MLEVAPAAFASFLLTIDPVGGVPFLIALTAGLSPERRRAVALKSVNIAAGILLLFTLIGQPVLHYLGVTLPAFRIAGGILLMLLAIYMVVVREGGIRAPTPREAEDVAQRCPHPEVAVFPLAIPLIAGPGAIASTILLQSQHVGDFAAQALSAGVMLGVLMITALAFFMCETIMRLLGLTGVAVLSRVLGIILAALAANNIIEGLRASFPVLG